MKSHVFDIIKLTIVIDRMVFLIGTKSNRNASSRDKDKASQLFNCANSILEGCKDTAVFSHLDIAIHLFRQVLEQRPAAHPLRADSLKDLARALSTRFSFTKQHEDLEQAILLRVEIVQQVQGMSAEGPLQNNVRVKCCIVNLNLQSS